MKKPYVGVDMYKKHFQIVVPLKKILQTPVLIPKIKRINLEYDNQIVTGNFFPNPVLQFPKVVWGLCYVNSHMNSTRKTRKSSEICGNGPKSEPGSHQSPLVFLGLWMGPWRPAMFQLVGRHFLLL